jgi:hypothetical protein
MSFNQPRDGILEFSFDGIGLRASFMHGHSPFDIHPFRLLGIICVWFFGVITSLTYN